MPDEVRWDLCQRLISAVRKCSSSAAVSYGFDGLAALIRNDGIRWYVGRTTELFREIRADKQLYRDLYPLMERDEPYCGTCGHYYFYHPEEKATPEPGRCTDGDCKCTQWIPKPLPRPE